MLLAPLPLQAQEQSGGPQAGVADQAALSDLSASQPVATLPGGALPAGELPPEAPASLFTVKGPADADVTITGSWKASLSSALTLSIGSLGTSYGFSGSPLLFSQTPDLLLSLVVNGSWFLEAVIAQSLDDSSFAFGYRGGKEGIVKEVRAGDSGLKFAPRYFLDFGSSGNKSFGASASFGSPEGSGPGFSAQALLRLDSMKPRKDVYYGLEKATETTIQASAFLTGRFFLLPDSDIRNIAIYLRSASGLGCTDGFSYTRLAESGYSYSLTRGSVEIDTALADRALIAYERSDSLPITASPTYSIDGRTAIPLFDPGTRLDTEVLSRYDPGDIDASYTSVSFSIESNQAGSLDTVFGARLLAGEDSFEVYKLNPAASEAATLALRPFDTLAPEIYRPGALPKNSSPVRIIETTRQKKERLEIDSKALGDTIRVYRDGVRDSAFSYVAGSGYVDLRRPPLSSEKIEVEYMTASDSASEDFVGGLAFDYLFSENAKAYVALGTRWSIPGSRVSLPDSLTAGYLGASTGLSWKTDEWQASLDLGAKYARQDANDACRLDGMEDYLHTQKASAGTWIRSVIPGGYAEAQRGTLIYRNYHKSDVFGGTSLATIESGYAPSAVDVNSKQGPYPVGDRTFGTAFAAEFSLDTGKTWCGIQLTLDSEILDNLPQAQSLVVPLRFLSDSGSSPGFSLQAGMLGKSSYDSSAASYGLPDSRFVASASALPSSSWAEYEIPLTTAVLAGMREGASVMIVISSLTASSGRCIVGDIRLKGADYVKAGDAASTQYLRLEQRYSDGPEISYAAQIAKWRDSTSGNAYLRLIAAGNSGAADLSAYKRFSILPLSSYKKLSFYLRWNVTAGAAPALSLSLSDASGVFLSAGLPLGATAGWGRADIDLGSGAGAISYPDGSSTPFTAGVSRIPSAESATLRWTLSGIQDGTVDLDELGLSDSKSSISAQANFSIVRQKTGSILNIGGIDAVSGFLASLSGQLGVGTDSFDYAAQAKAGVSLFPFDLSAGTTMAGSVARAQAASLPLFKTNHEIALPFPGGRASTYFSQDSSTGDFSQRDQASFALAPVSATAEATASQSGNKASQSWKGSFVAAAPSEAFGLEATLTNELVRANPLASLLYPNAWLRSFSYLIPIEDGADGAKRRSTIGFTAISGRPGFGKNKDGSLQASATYADGTLPLKGAASKLSLTPLIKLGKNGGFRLTPLYERSSALVSSGELGSFREDAEFFAYSLDCLPSIWKAIPFAELFDSRSLNELRALAFDPEKAVQETKIGLGMDRDAMFGLWEILVPCAVSYSLDRVSRRSGSVSTEKLVHEASLGISALDLFGKKGIRPLSRAFDTDEYGLTNTLKLSQNVVGEENAYQYAATLYAIFGIEEGAALKLKDDLRLGSEDERFADSLAATLTLAGPAGKGAQEARKSLLGWVKKKENAKESAAGAPISSGSPLSAGSPLSVSSPLSERLLEQDMTATTVFGLGADMSLDKAGLFALSVPLSYEAGLNIERSLKLSAGTKVSFGWRRNSNYSQFDLGLALSVQARVEF